MGYTVGTTRTGGKSMAGNDDNVMRRTVKDSVFCDLFSRPRYALQLYRALHPEDTSVSEASIEIVTQQCVVATHQYNDLGLTVGDSLLVLVEAQSTWSTNIAARALMYAADTLRAWVYEHEVDLYRTSAVTLPRPELYVVYTGKRTTIPATVTLDSCFGSGADINATVHVLRDNADGIIGEYVEFAHTIDRWRAKRGRTRESILRAIRECVDRNVLAEYLAERESEVVDIMMMLYDAEEVMRIHMKDAVRTAEAAGRAEGRAEGAAIAERNFASLVSALLAAGRTDDAARAAADAQARAQLYAELGIA